MTFKEYVKFYDKYGKTPNQLKKPKNKLNYTQLQSRYKKYQKRQETIFEREFPLDEKWLDVRAAAYKRDKYTCQLRQFIIDDYMEVHNELYGELAKLDPCHIFGKGSFPHLKYDLDNIVILSRLFHGKLDTFKHPFTSEKLSYEQRQKLWEKIVGKERLNV